MITVLADDHARAVGAHPPPLPPFAVLLVLLVPVAGSLGWVFWSLP